MQCVPSLQNVRLLHSFIKIHPSLAPSFMFDATKQEEWQGFPPSWPSASSVCFSTGSGTAEKAQKGKVSCTNPLTQESLLSLSSVCSLPSILSNTIAQEQSIYGWCLTAKTPFQLTTDTMAPNLNRRPMVSFLPLQPGQHCVAYSWGEDSSGGIFLDQFQELVNTHHTKQILSLIIA